MRLGRFCEASLTSVFSNDGLSNVLVPAHPVVALRCVPAIRITAVEQDGFSAEGLSDLDPRPENVRGHALLRGRGKVEAGPARWRYGEAVACSDLAERGERPRTQRVASPVDPGSILCSRDSRSASCCFGEVSLIAGVDGGFSSWCGDTAQAPDPHVGTPKRGSNQRLRKNHKTSTPTKINISFMFLFYSWQHKKESPKLSGCLCGGGMAESTRAGSCRLSLPGTTWHRISLGRTVVWRVGGLAAYVGTGRHVLTRFRVLHQQRRAAASMAAASCRVVSPRASPRNMLANSSSRSFSSNK